MSNRRIGSAKELTLVQVAELFAEGVRDYLLPMRVTAGPLGGRICHEPIALAASRGLFDGAQPAALALIARRGRVSRLAAMGVAPSSRRTGAGRALLDAVVR